MRLKQLWTLWIVVLLSSTYAPTVISGEFISLSCLPDGTFVQSSALGVSGDGKVVVGYCDRKRETGEYVREAFRWTRSGGMIGLGFLPGDERISVARAASYDGSVIVGDSGEEAFRWTESTGVVGSGERSVANGVSADGSVIVGWRLGLDNFEAFRWTEATGIVGLGIPDDAVQSFAEGVSADGKIIVGWADNGAFRWSEETGMQDLGDLRGSIQDSISEALGISADGSVIVGGARNSDGADEAFRWTEMSGMEGLGIPSGQNFNPASDASADGSVIVGLPGNVTYGEAFIWDAANDRRPLKYVLEKDFNLDISGWTLIAASAISDAGDVIVGYGINPKGMKEGWVARLDSAPPPDDKNIILHFEEPKPGDTRTGVGNLRGWAIARTGIQRVEFYLDGGYKFDIPYGGSRNDVGASYPDYLDSEDSGFSMAFNYGLLVPGVHRFKVRAYDSLNRYRETATDIDIVRFHDPFFSDPNAIDVSTSAVSQDGFHIVIENLTVDGEPYDVKLQWRKESQDFDIIEIE